MQIQPAKTNAGWALAQWKGHNRVSCEVQKDPRISDIYFHTRPLSRALLSLFWTSPHSHFGPTALVLLSGTVKLPFPFAYFKASHSPSLESLPSQCQNCPRCKIKTIKKNECHPNLRAPQVKSETQNYWSLIFSLWRFYGWHFCLCFKCGANLNRY